MASPVIILLFLLLLSFSIFSTASEHAKHLSSSDHRHLALGIEIGIGRKAAAAVPEPQPSDFLNTKQYESYKVIQQFKKTITCDPKNVTGTWVGSRPCLYSGFYCDVLPGSANTSVIAAVDFNGFGLCAPTLAGLIDALPDIALFHANSNNFSGTLPLALALLSYLSELDVSNNKLSGIFPASAILPLAGKLTFLDIRFNLFDGTVPNSVFNLGLDALFLNDNRFLMQLPTDLGSFTAAYLVLANNGFTGPIPRSIGRAAATLVEVLFLNNQLSGCLPYEVGLLQEVRVFDASLNEITGSIPLSFGCLWNIEQLNLAGNKLYGHIPDLLCMLPNIMNLSLSGNYFVSMGPTCRKLLNEKVLDIRGNCLPAGFPGQRSVEECAKFYAQPKSCPFMSYIPCSLHYNGNDSAALRSPQFLLAPEQQPVQRQTDTRRTAAAPLYVSYNALHRRHVL